MMTYFSSKKAAYLIFCISIFFSSVVMAQTGEDMLISKNNWEITISKTSGAITGISNTGDNNKMNFVHDKYAWGILILNDQVKTLFDHPESVKQVNDHRIESIYQESNLRLSVIRDLNANGDFNENYTLTNTGAADRVFGTGNIDLVLPFNDTYNGGASVCLKQNCNAHIWAGGASSWVNAERMDGVAPHLGMVLTKGNLSSYSILEGCTSNDRGKISVNPAAFTLKPGASYTLSWKLFWNTGWVNFWQQALAKTPVVQLKADHYTIVQGQDIQITATAGTTLDKATVTLNGKNIPVKHSGKILMATIKKPAVGEQVIQLDNNGQKSILKANVIIDPMALTEARVEFIIDKQQRNEPGTPFDGAYLIWENDDEKQFVDKKNDWNEARERMGMGVLLALYLPHCNDAVLKEKIVASLSKFQSFIAREIQDTAGVVYNAAHYKDSHRIYNSPWVGHFHLAMYKATGDRRYLSLFAKTVKAYYGKSKGVNLKAYPIGVQIMDGLKELKAAGMTSEYAEVLERFTNHANSIATIGGDYPKSEVNYEQSIVAPGVQIELEAYLITKDSKYLASAKQQLAFLESFNGQQPDYHLNDLGIRHWDDYWFGKLRLYGDTFPHYWQTITAVAFDEYATATGDQTYHTHAIDILMNNMCQFTPEGRAYCAYVYPLTASGGAGQRFDPRANDQDWALVNWLTVVNRTAK